MPFRNYRSTLIYTGLGELQAPVNWLYTPII